MKNGLIIDKEGNKEYYRNALLHREDGPAVEWANGSKLWYLHGKRHRVDGPAVEWVSGAKRWYFKGKIHRVDGPAEELADGTKFWYLHGKQHRVDGPAEEWSDGTKFWLLHDKQLIRPKEFKTMVAFIEKLNTDEEYSLPWINDFNGLIEFIKNPTAKQKRLHAIKWKL